MNHGPKHKMALEYMIGVYNRYANLLDDTEDPEIMSALQVAEKKLDVLAKQAKKIPIDKNKEKRQAKPKKNDGKNLWPCTLYVVF
ncbi:hypothetical protein B566_EDAN017606 [Ephemera danica]|nr:hypothetical protein B566_EDAN017606 [Ephemera danica]